MSLNFKANCYGFATGCHKFYFFPIGCRKPEKVAKHWSSAIYLNATIQNAETFQYGK